jgi:hypothetical protein
MFSYRIREVLEGKCVMSGISEANFVGKHHSEPALRCGSADMREEISVAAAVVSRPRLVR